MENYLMEVLLIVLGLCGIGERITSMNNIEGREKILSIGAIIFYIVFIIHIALILIKK